MAGPVRIAILADGSQAERTMRSVSSRASGMASSMAGVGRKIAGGLAIGAAGVAAFGVSAVKSASDAQQSLGATQTVFGKYADTVIKRSNEAANALGLSANEYRELSNVTGALLQGAGVPLKKVTGLTGDLNTMAADLAATFGGTTREAVESISSLLKGEADPIEKYGISIKQSDVSARLAAKGLDKLTGSGLKQAEMTARLELLQQKAARTQGAFARESGTLANQQQKLTAQVENLKARLGTALLPILTRVFGYVNATVIPAVTKFGASIGDRLGPVIDRVKGGLTDLLDRLRPVGDWLRDNPAAIRGAGIALGIAAGLTLALAAAMGVLALATSPITLTILAVAALGAGLALAYKRSETFRNVVQRIGAFIRDDAVPALQQFAGYVITKVIPAVVRTAQAIGVRLRPILTQLAVTFRERIQPTIAKVVAKFRELWPTISRVVAIVARAYGSFLRLQAAVAGKVIPVLIRWAGFVVSKVIPAAADIIGIVVKVIAKVIDFGQAFVRSQIKVAAFVRNVVSKIGETIGAVMEIPSRATSALGDLGGVLYSKGADLVQGLINGVTSKLDAVRDKVNELAGIVKDALPGSPVKTGPLKAWNDGRGGVSAAGRRLVDGLAKGINDGRPQLERTMAKVAGTIASTRTDLTGRIRLTRGTNGAAVALPGSTSSGARPIQVIVNAPVGSSPEDIGRTLTKYLDAWAASGGRAVAR